MDLNKKIIGFSIILFLTINTGCAVDSIKIEKRSFFDFKYMQESEKTILFESDIKIPEHKLNQWFPKQFTEKGKLSLRWKKEIDKEYCEGYYYASYPHAWGLKDCFLVDPYTGKSPETAKWDEKSVPFNDGITDGEYIFGFYNHKLSHSGCWRIKDQYMIWKNLAALYDTQFYIIDHKLIHMMEYPATITRLNPWTGHIIWSFYSLDKQRFNGDRVISSTQSEEYLYVVLNDIMRFEIIRIDSEDGNTKSILSTTTRIKSIQIINDNLWVLFGMVSCV